MKRSFYALGLMLAATFTLTNCAKEMDAPVQEPSSTGIPFEIIANAVDTKTTNDGMSTVWAEGDTLNVFHAVAGTSTYVDNGAFGYGETENGNFAGTLAEELTEEAYDWYASYPYSAKVTTPASKTSGWMAVGSKSNAVQTQTGNNSMAHIAGENYPLYGVAKNVAVGETPEITMNHLTSLIEVNVYNEMGEDIVVSNISFTAPEAVIGTYYIDFTGTEPAFVSSGANFVSNTATLNVVDGEAIVSDEEPAKFYLAVKPFTAAAGSTMTIKVTTSDGKYQEYPATRENDVVFKPGKIKKLNIYVSTLNEAVTAPEGISTIYDAVTSTNQSSPDEFSVKLTNAVVTYVNGSNAYLEDTTGGILIYKSSHGFNAGDQLNGVLSGTAYIRYGVLQIASFDMTGVTKSESAEVPVTVLTLDELLANYTSYVSRRVKVEGVLVTDAVSGSDRNGAISQSGKAIDLYAGLTNKVTYALGTNVDFVCYPSYYNTTKQLSVWENPTVNEICAAPVISCENNTVTITSVIDGVTIYYTTDGTDPNTTSTVYTEPFEIDSNCTVKAYAVKDGWEDSSVSSEDCVYQAFTTSTASLSFANKAQRTEFSTSKQVWKQNGVVLTNDKSSSTSNVADYANPARFYKSSKLTIEMEDASPMTKIEFTCNTASYATALKSSIAAADGVTVSVSSAVVTVEFATPQASFVIASLTGGQVRMNSLIVTYTN